MTTQEAAMAVDGGALSGNFNGPQGSVDFADGTVEGDSVAWSVKVDAPMGEVNLAFDGDSISGRLLTPTGESDFSGSRA
jgi:hypothetical protein